MEDGFNLTSFDDTLDSTDDIFDSMFCRDNNDGDQVTSEVENDGGVVKTKNIRTEPINDDVPAQSRHRVEMVSVQTGSLLHRGNSGEVDHGNRTADATEENEAGAIGDKVQTLSQAPSQGSILSIVECINKCNPKFHTPSQLLKTCSEKKSTKVMSGQFIAGYVIDSSGSLNQQRLLTPTSRGGSSRSRPTKKQKVTTTGYHSLLICDDTHILKLWSSYHGSSSEDQIKSVRRLAAMPEKSFVCVVIETGPLELRTTIEKYKKYVEATKEIKVQLVKAKILSLPQQPTSVPTFTPCRGDALEANTWMEVDTVIQEKESFEINGTFAVLDIEGRHDPFISTSGIKYLRGTLQDETGSTRKFTVWNHIAQFLGAIPESVVDTPKVVAFRRLRIKPLSHSAYGTALRIPSVSTNTYFEVLDIPYEEFYSPAEQQSVSLEDLQGFE